MEKDEGERFSLSVKLYHFKSSQFFFFYYLDLDIKVGILFKNGFKK